MTPAAGLPASPLRRVLAASAAPAPGKGRCEGAGRARRWRRGRRLLPARAGAAGGSAGNSAGRGSGGRGGRRPGHAGRGSAVQMAQGSSYWKMIFTWSFDSGHAALAVEPPADRVRRGLGSLPKSPGGFPPPSGRCIVHWGGW